MYKNNKIIVTLISSCLILVSCGGGSVSGYGNSSGNNTGSTVHTPIPTATPFGATYGSAQSVTLTAKAGATFYYTTDGTPPTTSSTLYTGPINISATTTLKAIAKGADGVLSAVITEVYTIDTTAPIVSLSPSSDPTIVQYVSLTSNEPGVIYYTTDGSIPSTASNIYTSPIATKQSPKVIVRYLAYDIAGNPSTNTPVSYPVTTSAFTDIKVENTGGIQSNVPITFGHAFKVGELTTGTSASVEGTLSSGINIPLQVNVKATHADGSVRHAIISAVLSSLGAGATETISFTKKSMDSTAAIAPVVPTNLASVDVTISGVTYSANAATLLAGPYIQWLSGPIVNEWIVSGPLRKVSDNAAHPHLEARFAIRSFAGSSKTKVDVSVENNKTFTAGSQNFTYDSKIYVEGALVDTITGLEHFHHARWHKSFWWGTAPQVHLKHNIDYLIATKAVPNYDRSVVPSATTITSMVSDMVGKTGPMKAGLVLPYMPTTGGRIDIGPMPGWYALYLLSMDKGAKDVMLGIADTAGSWPIHYRDDTSTDTTLTPGVFNTSGFPIRIDKKGDAPATGGSLTGVPYRDITVHGNLASSGPLPVPSLPIRLLANQAAG